MIPAGIEPATFRYVAQHLNHCDTAVPKTLCAIIYILLITEHNGDVSPENY